MGVIFGANKQNRTADLRVTNPLLYQLSYIGISYCTRRILPYISHNVNSAYTILLFLISIIYQEIFSGIFSYNGTIKFSAESTVLDAS